MALTKRQPKQKMLHQMLGYDDQFPPYEYQEYPKHIRRNKGDKEFEVVNSEEEEEAVRRTWDPPGRSEVGDDIAPPARVVLGATTGIDKGASKGSSFK